VDCGLCKKRIVSLPFGQYKFQRLKPPSLCVARNAHGAAERDECSPEFGKYIAKSVRIKDNRTVISCE
jgi:hypothetical protein